MSAALDAEAPSAPISRVPSTPTIIGHQEPSSFNNNNTSVQPVMPGPNLNESPGRVDLGFFDPEGVQELRRTMTQKSRNVPPEEHSRPSFASSAITLSGLAVGDGPFDFEKTLRHVIRK